MNNSFFAMFQFAINYKLGNLLKINHNLTYNLYQIWWFKNHIKIQYFQYKTNNVATYACLPAGRGLYCLGLDFFYHNVASNEAEKSTIGAKLW